MGALLLATLLFGSSSSTNIPAGQRPHSVFDVRTFGAKGDGRSDDTAAVAAALAAAAAASAAGSAVTVRLAGPKSVYLVDRPLIFNASNALLHIEAGAVLRWHWPKDLSFTSRWAQGGGHSATMLTVEPTPGSPPLTNVSIGGGGMLDGQGFMWWPFRYHVTEYIHAQKYPPFFLEFTNIKGLQVANITILDPPMITLQTCACWHVDLHHLNISASWLTPAEFYSPAHSPTFAQWRAVAPVTAAGTGQNGTCGSPGMRGGRVWADRPDDPRCEPANTDGIDPGCGSKDVHIHDIFIENGDDSIVMKQGWPKANQVPPEGCTRDVLVERVVIYRGMGANIGGMGNGCVDNITFKDIVLDHPSLMGAQIKTENGKDNRSFVSNVLYQNVSFRNSLNASGYPCLSITADYTGDGHGYAGKSFPKISNVSYRDIDLRGCSTPITLKCSDKQPCEGISLDSVRTAEAVVCENVDCTAVNVTAGMAKCCGQQPLR